MKGALIVGLVVVAVILAILAAMFAEGAPTTPAVSLYTQIQPGTAQSLLFQVQFGFYSVTSPNAIWAPGYHITYSAVERGAGVTTVLVTNGTSAPQINSVSNSFYVMQSTISVVTVASCSGSGCLGITENITFTAQANVVTPYTAWFSSPVTVVFSSINACTPAGSACPVYSGPTQVTPPQSTAIALNTFLLELAVPLTAIVAIASFVVLLMGGRHPGIMGLAIGATVAVFVEFLVW
jgi:hypothetical protein